MPVIDVTEKMLDETVEKLKRCHDDIAAARQLLESDRISVSAAVTIHDSALRWLSDIIPENV